MFITYINNSDSGQGAGQDTVVLTDTVAISKEGGQHEIRFNLLRDTSKGLVNIYFRILNPNSLPLNIYTIKTSSPALTCVSPPLKEIRPSTYYLLHFSINIEQYNYLDTEFTISKTITIYYYDEKIKDGNILKTAINLVIKIK